MTEPVLSLADVHAFYGNSHVLHGVSLDLSEGEVVALLGRNGAGKTTTMRTIVGVVPPRRGSVVYRGTDVAGRSVDDISAMGIKLVPEDRRIFPTLTVQENLALARRLAAGSARDVEEMYDLFPALDGLRRNAGRNLSGGEQQMLAVARALVQDPDVLLLDEPSEGLAPVVVSDLRAALAGVLAEDVTVLLTEQNVGFAFEIASRSYVIDKGSVVFEGSVSELRARDRLLEEHLSVSSSDLEGRA